MKQLKIHHYGLCWTAGGSRVEGNTCYELLVRVFHKNTFFQQKNGGTHQSSAWGFVWRDPKWFLILTKFRGSSGHLKLRQKSTAESFVPKYIPMGPHGDLNEFYRSLIGSHYFPCPHFCCRGPSFGPYVTQNLVLIGSRFWKIQVPGKHFELHSDCVSETSLYDIMKGLKELKKKLA